MDLVPTIVVRKVRRERSCHAVGDHAPIRVFELASHGAGIHFPQASAQKFAAWQAQRDLGLGVQVREPPFLVEREEGVGDALQNAIARLSAARSSSRSRRSSASACWLGDIAKDQHHAGKTTFVVLDRRGTVVDGAFAAVLGDQHRMIRQPLGLADGQHLLHGIENRGPRRLVDDDENLVERLSLRLRSRSSRSSPRRRRS